MEKALPDQDWSGAKRRRVYVLEDRKGEGRDHNEAAAAQKTSGRELM